MLSYEERSAFNVYEGKIYNVFVLNSCVDGYFETTNNYDSISYYVLPKSEETKNEATKIIKEKLSEYLTKNEYNVVGDMESIFEQVNAVFGIVELVFGGIAGLSLLVGIIGMLLATGAMKLVNLAISNFTEYSLTL